MPKKLSKQASFGIPPAAVASIVPSSLLDPSLPLPRLIVFDLDYTLWPFWCDTHVTPPIKPSDPPRNTAAADKYGEDFSFYTDVPSILQALPHLPALAGADQEEVPPIRLAVASRTSAPNIARDLLKLFLLHPISSPEDDSTSADLGPTQSNSSSNNNTSTSTSGSSAAAGKPRRAVDVFDAGLEMYPGSKIRHFELIQKRTGVRYEDMLFFDDESRNKETESLGVTMCLVRDGVSWGEIARGVDEWRKRRGYSNGKRSG